MMDSHGLTKVGRGAIIGVNKPYEPTPFGSVIETGLPPPPQCCFLGRFVCGKFQRMAPKNLGGVVDKVGTQGRRTRRESGVWEE